MKDNPRYPRFRFSIEAEIRPAREDDLEALEWLGLYAAHRQIIRAAFAAQERGDALLLLAVSAGFPVAQVWIDFTGGAQPGIALVWAVRTFYPLQGHGIGRRMMQTAEAEMRRRGFAHAELGIERDNLRAMRFYRRLGWSQKGARHQSFEIADGAGAPQAVALDLWVMEKSL